MPVIIWKQIQKFNEKDPKNNEPTTNESQLHKIYEKKSNKFVEMNESFNVIDAAPISKSIYSRKTPIEGAPYDPPLRESLMMKFKKRIRNL